MGSLAGTIELTRQMDTQTSKRQEALRVAEMLEEYCASHTEGDKIPTHTELMRLFGASERNVLRALDEMQRYGRIVRRPGAGTFIASGTPLSSQAVDDALTANTIVAIARPDQSFFDRCVDLLYGHAKNVGKHLMFRVVDSAQAASETVWPAAAKPSGYVVFSYLLEPAARRLHEAGNRVVIVGTPPIDAVPDVPCVSGDQEHGGYLVTRHLIELGHRHIVYPHPDHTFTQQRRWAGAMRAILEARRAGHVVEATMLSLADKTSWWSNPAEAGHYFSVPGAPTAIAAWNDYEALRLAVVLGKAGISIPGDVSLIGYDALPAGEILSPQLSTVDGGVNQQLDAAIRLLNQPVPPPSASSVVVLPSLLARGSTAQPRP
ncbi:MAG TPA: substrate-binding domain-containing protein [Capsulimonadaceae bacterium]|jgi:DNA-binding LacI/PurR family transcriptional regulator